MTPGIDEANVPDSQTLTHVMQHIDSTNQPIYEDGFTKFKVWCRDVPEWVLHQDTNFRETPLLEIVLRLARDLTVDEGNRAGHACDALAAMTQKQKPRELIAQNGAILEAVMAVLKAESGVASSARLSAAKCIQNLTVDLQMKEKVRLAGAMPFLLSLLGTGDEDFQSAYQGLGALMNLSHSPAGMRELHKLKTDKPLADLERLVKQEDPMTGHHHSIVSRIHFLRVNMRLNSADDEKQFKLVDPALLAKELGAVTGKVKKSAAKGKKKGQATTEMISHDDMVDAISEKFGQMNNTNQKMRKKRDGVKAKWGKAQKVFNQNV